MKNTVHSFDRTLTEWIVMVFGPNARPFFEMVTMLGDPISITLITVAISTWGFIDRNMKLVAAGLAIPATVITGFLLKEWFERARPMTDYVANMKLQTFSFPSGHSSGSMIAFGLLAYLALVKLPAGWNIAACVCLAIVPFFVGISRVYLGAHFPSDVLAGWLLGGIVLTAVIVYLKPLS